MILEENQDNEATEELLEACDDFFWENEEELRRLPEEYAAGITL